MSTYKEARELLNASYNVTSVLKGVRYYQNFLLSKCQNLFIYTDLPDTLPAWEIEKNLIIKGNGCVVKKNGELYIPFTGSVFGFDEYYVPNRFTYAQPVLGSGTVKDGEDGAILWNMEIDKVDYNRSVLFETIQRYSRMLADLESTYASILVAQRAGRVGIASTSQVAKSVDDVMSKLELGECKTIINTTSLMDTFKPLSFMPTGSIMEFTTVRDYLLNCFYNEIGFQTLEEKRERMITSELETETHLLNNNIHRMYMMRLENVIKINKIFGTNITVKMYNEVGGE